MSKNDNLVFLTFNLFFKVVDFWTESLDKSVFSIGLGSLIKFERFPRYHCYYEEYFCISFWIFLAKKLKLCIIERSTSMAIWKILLVKSKYEFLSNLDDLMKLMRRFLSEKLKFSFSNK